MRNMQNISVYLNRRASNSSSNWMKQINNALFRSHVNYHIPNDLDELYQKLDIDVVNNIDIVLSIGGDGTVNTLIQRLAGTEIGLLVIPGGTANDLAQILGSDTNIKHITQTIRQNIRKKIDLISVNGKFMATNGGLGFVSEVASEINELRKTYPQFKKIMKLTGKSIYSAFLAKKLLAKEIKSLNFKIESREFSETVLSPFILINNQPVLGGNFEVAPNTSHQDGTFNVTIFKHQNRLELIQCILKILSGPYPIEDKNIISFETSDIKIDLLDNEKIGFFGDGEILNYDNSWTIKCHPSFLSVFSPKDKNDLVNFCTEVSLM